MMTPSLVHYSFIFRGTVGRGAPYGGGSNIVGMSNCCIETWRNLTEMRSILRTSPRVAAKMHRISIGERLIYRRIGPASGDTGPTRYGEGHRRNETARRLREARPAGEGWKSGPRGPGTACSGRVFVERMLPRDRLRQATADWRRRRPMRLRSDMPPRAATGSGTTVTAKLETVVKLPSGVPVDWPNDSITPSSSQPLSKPGALIGPGGPVRELVGRVGLARCIAIQRVRKLRARPGRNDEVLDVIELRGARACRTGPAGLGLEDGEVVAGRQCRRGRSRSKCR